MTDTTGLLRLATAGSVDDGKSTLIGRLLYDAQVILTDQLDHVEHASRRMGDGYVNLALVTDGLRAEREQGITIDAAYRYFATPRRRFIVADNPGHARYTRNMVTGASTADLSVLLIDARKGVIEQTKRHAVISALMGVRHFVICVNKMDLVQWSQSAFERHRADFAAFVERLAVPDLTFIPISALHGDNVVKRSANMPWYEGPSLLYHLERVHSASDRNLVDVRFPVQLVIRPMSEEHHDYRAYAGQVAGGVLRPGDPVVVLPSGESSRIAAIDGPDGPVAEAFPPMSVALRLADDVDVARGDMICRPRNRPRRERLFEAIVCWMSAAPAVAGSRYLLKHTTRWTHALVKNVRYRLDVETLHRDEAAAALGLNDVGRLELQTSEPLTFDDYRRNRATGSFILVDGTTNDTVGGGIVMAALTGEAHGLSGQRRSPGVTWDTPMITRPERWRALDQHGATVWLTGLPAAGKSTIASALEQRLIADGHTAYRLDGDNLRHGLCGDLGFSPEDRVENVRRAAHVAHLFADSGAVAIVSLVSPYARGRGRVRELHVEDELVFVEVHVDTPVEECKRRDPQGLYARALRGELRGMTGVDDPYERPVDAEVTVPVGSSVEQAVGSIVAVLRARGVLEGGR